MLASAGLSVSLKHEVFIVDIIFLEGLWQKLTTKKLTLGSPHRSTRTTNNVFLTSECQFTLSLPYDVTAA
jgi:hypothetical protein